jgi:hypothetical protein
MIKLVLAVIAVLALLGGAIQFESDEQSWSLVVNKEAALSSVKNGAIKIYDFSRGLMSSNGQTEGIGIITDN